MKKIYVLLTAASMLTTAGMAQNYCSVNTATPYVSNMPGITHFVLGSIDRTSLSVENYPNNSYVSTGQSTNLTQGQSYPVTITHSEDAANFPGARNNLRVWIDYNHNGTLDDAGETAILADLQSSGTYTGTIVVPVSAMTGSTRMRVTAKMSSDAGHTLPTPCDNPADPIGYHGEIEDYSVNIMTPNGVNETAFAAPVLQVSPNPFRGEAAISFSLADRSAVTLEVYNMLGEKQTTILSNESLAGGLHQYRFSLDKEKSSEGIYFVRLISGASVVAKQVVLTE